MARDSRIEWTDHTFNPWWGCTKVSAACDHCYAETWHARIGLDIWSAGKPRRYLSEAYWQQPHKWNTAAANAREQGASVLRIDGRRVRVEERAIVLASPTVGG